MTNSYYPFINTPLPYGYSALEPYIDTCTMHLHHDRHLQTYIDHLNSALKDEPELQTLSLEQLLTDTNRLPRRLQTVIKNNAGGVYNHRFYFDGMSGQLSRPSGELSVAIDRQFGSFDRFIQLFRAVALAVFGSGYAWLAVRDGRLIITATANQDTPIALGMCPIICIDVWEHAYYLKHQNVRAGYFDDWINTVNWPMAEQRLEECMLKYK